MPHTSTISYPQPNTPSYTPYTPPQSLGLSDLPIQDLISLKNKTAVIVGGTKGIGLAISKRFLEAGANLTLVDKEENNNFQEAEAALKPYKIPFQLSRVDVRNPNSIERIAEAAMKSGRMDIWVNNAGIYPETPLAELDERRLDDLLTTNIKSVFYGCRAATRYMKAGSIILNIASVAALQTSDGLTHYSASKYAIRGLTEGFARELSDRNIRVMAIAPRKIKTPPLQAMKETLEGHHGHDPQEKLTTSHPDDIARIALFLASDLATFMTGSTLLVDYDLPNK